MTRPILRRNFEHKLVKVDNIFLSILTYQPLSVPLSCYEPLAIHYKEKHTISVIKEAEGCSQITSNQCVFIKAILIIHKANITNKVETYQHLKRLYLRTGPDPDHFHIPVSPQYSALPLPPLTRSHCFPTI